MAIDKSDVEKIIAGVVGVGVVGLGIAALTLIEPHNHDEILKQYVYLAWVDHPDDGRLTDSKGETVYFSEIEIYNGGFRKRLSDYRRESNSARKHILGRTINEYLDEITTYILVEGDTEEAVAETKWLEGQFIAYYGFSEWNSNSTFKIYRLSGGKGGWNEKRGV